MNTIGKCFFRGNIRKNSSSLLYIEGIESGILIGDMEEIKKILELNEITTFHIELIQQNALWDYPYDFPKTVRIEKGAVIREGVILKDGAIILMNATVNKNAVIGENTMVDMNAVIGSGAIIGDNTHIGAGAVISGIMEPISKVSVNIGNNVFIGALSVVLEGVKIEDDAVIGAGSVVTKNVKKGEVVWGAPAKCHKMRSDLEIDKVNINKSLRK